MEAPAIEVLKLIAQNLFLLLTLLVVAAFIVAGLKMMNTLWDVRYREQKIKLEAEDLQKREHLLVSAWERLHEAKQASMETRLAESSAKKRGDSDPNIGPQKT